MGVLEVVLPGRRQMSYLGKEGFAWGTEGREKLYKLIIKWTSSKIVFKDFPNTLRVSSTHCFKFVALHKKCIFLNMS